MNVSTDPRLATMEKLSNPLEEVTSLMREVITELKGIKREVSRLSSTVTSALRERSSGGNFGDLYNSQQINGMDTCGLSSVASSSICGIDEPIKSPLPRFDIDEDIKGLEDGFVQISMKSESEAKLAKINPYIKLFNEKLLNLNTSQPSNEQSSEKMDSSCGMEQSGGIFAPFYARYDDTVIMKSSFPSSIFGQQSQESMTRSNILHYDPTIDLDKWLIKTRA